MFSERKAFCILFLNTQNKLKIDTLSLVFQTLCFNVYFWTLPIALCLKTTQRLGRQKLLPFSNENPHTYLSLLLELLNLT